MPYLGRVCTNRFVVPPYSEGEATMLSPAWAIVKMDRLIAPAPEDVSRAPTPPSRVASRASTTSQVGFVRRE